MNASAQPPSPFTVLVVAASAEDIANAQRVVETLLDRSCTAFGMELEERAIDPKLDWGTKDAAVVVGVNADDVAPPDHVEVQPPAEDGSAWKAVLDAAARYQVDMVAVSHRQQSWMRRVLRGSPTIDIVAHSGLPVLVLPHDLVRTVADADER